MSRVLIVSPFGPPHRGGLETYVGWLCECIAGAGHDVRLLSCDVRDVDAEWITPARDLLVGGGTSWPLVLPSPRVRSIVREAVSWADLVLHQNCFWNLTSLAASAARRAGRAQRTIVHAAFATYPGAGATTRVSADAYRLLLGGRQLSLAPPIAVSHASKAFIESEYGVACERVPCPLPGVPDIRGAQLEPGQPARIAWVGRIAPVKAPLDAVEAVRLLSQTHDVELHVFGTGPMEDRIPDEPFIIRRGNVARAELLHEVADCHLFLSSSLADNAQLALLEALVLGRPSVATSVGEAPAYLAHPLDRLLTKPADPTGTAATLTMAINDWDRWAALTRVRAGELRVEYDPGTVGDEMLRALHLAPSLS